MYIKQLHINDLRIIEEACVSPSPGINLITGDNGAGKTSFLEAIYLLGRGRSFRHRESGPFIRTGAKHSIVRAELEKEDGAITTIGVQRSSSTIRVRQDGEEVLKRSSLLKALPIQVISPKSHELIEKGPEGRRNFLDYGMFHVEPGYLELLTEYGRALKQRNAALRSGNLDVARSYNPLLSRSADNIQRQREKYIETLVNKLQSTLNQLQVNFEVQLALKPGMDTEISLAEELKMKERIELRAGYTTVGAHRADLVFMCEQVQAARRLSRGQQKILVYALKIAQSRTFMERRNSLPILMVDDLTAELDHRNLNAVLELLDGLSLQVFITLIAMDEIERNANYKLFHVEHGLVQSC